MAKPKLLLDVDGVLCPFEENEGYRRHAVGAEGIGHWVWVSEANRDRLARLSKIFLFHWATAWEERANEHLLEIHGLDPLPFISFVDAPSRLVGFSYSGSTTWKLPWIEEWAELDGGPFAWVDDDIGPDTIAWAEERTASGIPTLGIRIDPNIGLTDDHVQELEGWWSDASEEDGDGSGTPVLPVRKEAEAGTDVSEEAE